MFRPIYKANSLMLGDPASPVGIITCWTMKARVAGEVDSSQYAAIGQLYSPTKGIDYLFRNLLANPTIRCLIVTGQDLSGSGRRCATSSSAGSARLVEPRDPLLALRKHGRVVRRPRHPE